MRDLIFENQPPDRTLYDSLVIKKLYHLWINNCRKPFKKFNPVSLQLLRHIHIIMLNEHLPAKVLIALKIM